MKRCKTSLILDADCARSKPMKKITGLILAFLILATGCGLESKKQSRDEGSSGNPNTCDTHYEANDINEQVLQDEDYKVYSDLLMQLYPKTADKDIFVIQQVISRPHINIEALTKETKKFQHDFGPTLNDEMINEYIRVNTKLIKLQDKFAKQLHVVLLTDEQLREIFVPANGSWERFYYKYTGARGIINVSPIAFNADKTKAFFAYSLTSGHLDACGYHILMEKKCDKWVIQNQILYWVS
jgi:hypothetical protein